MGKSATSKVIAPSTVWHECYYDVIKHECRMARVQCLIICDCTSVKCDYTIISPPFDLQGSLKLN